MNTSKYLLAAAAAMFVCGATMESANAAAISSSSGSVFNNNAGNELTIGNMSVAQAITRIQGMTAAQKAAIKYFRLQLPSPAPTNAELDNLAGELAAFTGLVGFTLEGGATPAILTAISNMHNLGIVII